MKAHYGNMNLSEIKAKLDESYDVRGRKKKKPKKKGPDDSTEIELELVMTKNSINPTIERTFTLNTQKYTGFPGEASLA